MVTLEKLGNFIPRFWYTPWYIIPLCEWLMIRIVQSLLSLINIYIKVETWTHQILGNPKIVFFYNWNWSYFYVHRTKPNIANNYILSLVHRPGVLTYFVILSTSKIVKFIGLHFVILFTSKWCEIYWFTFFLQENDGWWNLLVYILFYK